MRIALRRRSGAATWSTTQQEGRVSKEILEGVQLVEKEKGIEPGTLLAAIEDALSPRTARCPTRATPCASTSTARRSTSPHGR